MINDEMPIITCKLEIAKARLGELNEISDTLESKLAGLLTEPRVGKVPENAIDICNDQSVVCTTIDGLTSNMIDLQNRLIEIIERIQN